MDPYCHSRYKAVRWRTREVRVGDVGIGGDNPIRVQSMTTTDTCDVDATVQQAIALAEVGCEIVRITAPNTKAAVALGEIRRKIRAAKIDVPLVADIHFTPKAAMEAVKHVEKVRINPGNYADRKKFKVREYSDNEYENELQRLYEAFSPIVLEAKKLGKAMRIGTNHGSLSDRIMNRYGDTPLGMVESALEFIRIAESHGYQDIVLSMKASNPKVMIEAYRLAVARMKEQGMAYPLHLGVTEAGDGEDARIKSTVGIGSLLYDGLGDTIRVSLTEDSVYEIPVARDLADRAMKLWADQAAAPDLNPAFDSIDPFTFQRRPVDAIDLGPQCPVAVDEPPRVVVAAHRPLHEPKAIVGEVLQANQRLKDAHIEGLLVQVNTPADIEALHALVHSLDTVVKAILPVLAPAFGPECLADFPRPKLLNLFPVRRFDGREPEEQSLAVWLQAAREAGTGLAVCTTAEGLERGLANALDGERQVPVLIASDLPESPAAHALGACRRLVEGMRGMQTHRPLWIRATDAASIAPQESFNSRLIEASLLAGPLLCDGLGDVLSIETEPDLARATALAYNILQGTRTRISKTEFVACPSCGRTLFDLQSTTQRIKERTGHLKGVTIAVMGCIVNGPGEMADADFGYVGGAPGKINLYVGKQAVKYNIPEAEAVERLVDLIAEHGKWIEPEDADAEPARA
ncbi:MAG: (E)-4-hydroxy-3-methylbut-2-enyl-diphosphate synthase [Opitutales bacterium]